MRAIFLLVTLLVGLASAEVALPRLLFNLVDSNGDGVISPEELSTYSFRMDSDNVANMSLAKQVMSLIDSTDNDAVLDLKEFCELAGDSCEDTNDNAIGVPEQVHLGPGVDDTEIVVSWVILGPSARAASGIVEFGSSEKNMSVTVAATSSTYSCGTPEWVGQSFTAKLTSLTPGSEYWYRVGDKISGNFTATFSFTTGVPSPTKPVRYVVIGDMGTIIPAGWKVARQIKMLHDQSPFDSMIHVGDIAYAGVSSLEQKEIPFVWDVYGRQMAPIAQNIPYITGVGNHEKYCDYASFKTRYTMPGDLQGGNGNMWFSSTRGLVHWLSMSTEENYDEASPQYKFLEQSLQKADANRHQVPWIVVIGHRPMYCSDEDEKEQHWPGATLQTLIEPLLRKYKVDMYIGGHMHCYERIHPISFNGTVDTQSIKGNLYLNPNGTVHVVQGTAGSFEVEKWLPKPDWSASRAQKYGAGVMTVHNASALHYSFSDAFSGNLVDEFWIVKSAP